MLVTPAELEEIALCDPNLLTQNSSFTFSIKRDDSTHSSLVNYYDLTTNTEGQFLFDEGNVNFYYCDFLSIKSEFEFSKL